MADARDTSIVIQHYFTKILKKKRKIKILTDNKTLLNVVISNASTTERRLMIDIKATGEAYNGGIINDVICIRWQHNPADFETKYTILPHLVVFLQTGKVKCKSEQSALWSLGIETKDISLKKEKVTQKEEKFTFNNQVLNMFDSSGSNRPQTHITITTWDAIYTCKKLIIPN